MQDYKPGTITPEGTVDKNELSATWTQIWEKIKDIPMLVTMTHRQRLLIIGISLGWQQSRVARALGTHVKTIERWVKRPEFDRAMTEIQFRLGFRPVMEYFKDQLMPSIKTMIEIRDNKELDSNTRLRAAQLITEFAIGKPSQTIEQKGTDIKSLLREVRKQASETSTIRAEDVRDTLTLTHEKN